MTSAMPVMPMPPIPTMWIVPMSVLKAFIFEGVLSKGTPSRGDASDGSLRPDARSEAEAHGHRRQSAADPLDEVSEVARRMRPPDRQSPRRRVGQRLRVLRHRL